MFHELYRIGAIARLRTVHPGARVWVLAAVDGEAARTGEDGFAELGIGLGGEDVADAPHATAEAAEELAIEDVERDASQLSSVHLHVVPRAPVIGESVIRDLRAQEAGL